MLKPSVVAVHVDNLGRPELFEDAQSLKLRSINESDGDWTKINGTMDFVVGPLITRRFELPQIELWQSLFLGCITIVDAAFGCRGFLKETLVTTGLVHCQVLVINRRLQSYGLDNDKARTRERALSMRTVLPFLIADDGDGCRNQQALEREWHPSWRKLLYRAGTLIPHSSMVQYLLVMTVGGVGN
jgi:hypothetical protein